MTKEEALNIEKLTNAQASAIEQGKALKWMGDYLEESYILNLPPSKDLLNALKKVSHRASTDSRIKTQAKKLIKKYT